MVYSNEICLHIVNQGNLYFLSKPEKKAISNFIENHLSKYLFFSKATNFELPGSVCPVSQPMSFQYSSHLILMFVTTEKNRKKLKHIFAGR
jgi:hypothetical protein